MRIASATSATRRRSGEVPRSAEARAAAHARRPVARRAARAALDRLVPRRRLLLVEEVEIEDVFVSGAHRTPATLDEAQERKGLQNALAGVPGAMAKRADTGDLRRARPLRARASSSAAIGRCARSGAGHSGRSGSQSTSETVSTSR